MQKKLMKVSEVDEVIVTTIDQRKFSEKVFEAHQEVALLQQQWLR